MSLRGNVSEAGALMLSSGWSDEFTETEDLSLKLLSSRAEEIILSEVGEAELVNLRNHQDKLIRVLCSLFLRLKINIP